MLHLISFYINLPMCENFIRIVYCVLLKILYCVLRTVAIIP